MTLDDANSELGLGATIDEVLMPAMRRIGRWWETGRCDVGHEHLATEAARTWLGKIVAFARTRRASRRSSWRAGHATRTPWVGGTWRAPRPCRPTVLRARRSDAGNGVGSTINRVEPAAVVVVSHLSIGRRLAAQAVHTVAEFGVPTFYAGNAFISASTRHRVPGRYLGDSLRDAARVVETALVR